MEQQHSGFKMNEDQDYKEPVEEDIYQEIDRQEAQFAQKEELTQLMNDFEKILRDIGNGTEGLKSPVMSELTFKDGPKSV